MATIRECGSQVNTNFIREPIKPHGGFKEIQITTFDCGVCHVHREWRTEADRFNAANTSDEIITIFSNDCLVPRQPELPFYKTRD